MRMFQMVAEGSRLHRHGGPPLEKASSDFIFQIGNTAGGTIWSSAASPSAISIRAGAGVGGSDRVEITWADNDIPDTEWLQVQVLPDANTGLANTDVFYFGDAMGESGNSTTDATVNASDEIAARSHYTGSAAVTDQWDFNRDGVVDVNDELVARNNATVFFNNLHLMAAPGQVAAEHLCRRLLRCRRPDDRERRRRHQRRQRLHSPEACRWGAIRFW